VRLFVTKQKPKEESQGEARRVGLGNGLELGRDRDDRGCFQYFGGEDGAQHFL